MKILFNVCFLALLSFGAAIPSPPNVANGGPPSPVPGSPTPFALTPQNICLLMVDGTYIVDPTVCTTYYKCLGGIPTSYTCPSGQIFNKDTGACVPSSQGNCGNINTMCAGKSKGTFLPDIDSCGGYYYCNGVDAAGAHGSCPTGENFNPNSQRCDYAQDYLCSKTNSMQPICNYVPNGKYFGVNSNCASWAICNNGEYQTGSCAAGELFNTQLGVCDQDLSEVKCVQDAQPQSNNNNHALQGKDCSSWTTQYIKDPQSCSGFYFCNSQNVALWGQCANNKFFSNGQCVDRSTVTCYSSNVCENTQGKYTWVNDPFDCHKYYSCNKNVRSPISTACPNGMWFNEVAQMCSFVRPTYLACVGGQAPVTTSPGPKPPGPN